MATAILICGGVLVVALAVLLFRGGRSGTRTGDDGFYITGGYASGSRVRYECLVRGQWTRGVVIVMGGETFVYTGAPPTSVRILGVEDPDGRDEPPPSSGPAPSNDDVFAGIPSAY